MESHDILDTTKLNLSGTFNEQVSKVMHYIRLQDRQVEQMDMLINDLYHTFYPTWGDIQIMAFGSIITGLGIKTSDLDCYVELAPWLHPPKKPFVYTAKALLMANPHLYREVYAIAHAKVPIVKFHHLPTDVSCDISFTSSAGVENSRLIQYLLQMDNRALELAILIKYWSKIFNLTGTNLMPNYCLTLLVIFFLQQNNILPPVADLQVDVPEQCVDGWNTAFQSSNTITINNKLTLYKLLVDFFKFYKTFDFANYLISPYLGRPIKKDLFLKVETVPLGFPLYKNNVGIKTFKPIRLDTIMCVQDPYEHNRNCAVAVHPKLAQKIMSQLQMAVSVANNNTETDFLKKLLHNSSPPTKPPNRTQKRTPLQGVRKYYRHNPNIINNPNFINRPNLRTNPNLRNLRQNGRHMRNNNFRGRRPGHWR